MGYTTTTIAETVSRINQDLFIPAIQRPYVWTPEQIIGLFDSIMRGYPIGALMFWDLPVENHEDWEIYSFVENFRCGSIHNDRYEPNGPRPLSLVLDGQQRLTSLLIGLKGSYTVKRNNRRNVWDEKLLMIDLAKSPEPVDEHDEDDTSPIAPHYGLAFFDRDHIPHSRHGKLWFRIDTIRAIENEAELDRLLRDWVDGNLDLDDKQRANARANLERLWRAIWRDQAITYFTERGVSYDRVLDIFIRANSAGSPLSRDDLLMSVITLRWERFNARDETEGVIQYLNKKLAPKRNVNRKFILRTALFLNDLDFTIQVRNFVPRNIRLLEESWDRIKEILTFSADYLRASGLYGERLGGINVLMLVAYYVHKTNPGQGALQLSDKDRQRIRRWIVMLSFQGLLCLQTNNTFNVYRNTVCRALSRDTGFPWVEIAQAFQNMGRAIDFGDQSLNRWYSTPLDHQPQAELLLSLLYSDDLPNLRRRAVPVVQRYQFAPDELRRAGVEDTRMPVVKEYENKLILGVALDEAEQVNYRALPFEQWAQTLSPEFMTHHCLPTDIGLYRLDRLPDWVIERRNLLTQRLSNPIGD